MSGECYNIDFIYMSAWLTITYLPKLLHYHSSFMSTTDNHCFSSFFYLARGFFLLSSFFSLLSCSHVSSPNKLTLLYALNFPPICLVIHCAIISLFIIATNHRDPRPNLLILAGMLSFMLTQAWRFYKRNISI